MTRFSTGRRSSYFLTVIFAASISTFASATELSAQAALPAGITDDELFGTMLKAARWQAWNQPIHRVRGRIEKIIGTWKRSYSLRRMRWHGLAKAACPVRLTAIAYNLKHSLKIQTAA